MAPLICRGVCFSEFTVRVTMHQLQCFQVVDERPEGLRTGFSETFVVDSGENFEGVFGCDVSFSTGLEEPFDDSFRRIFMILFFDGFDPNLHPGSWYSGGLEVHREQPTEDFRNHV